MSVGTLNILTVLKSSPIFYRIETENIKPGNMEL